MVQRISGRRSVECTSSRSTGSRRSPARTGRDRKTIDRALRSDTHLLFRGRLQHDLGSARLLVSQEHAAPPNRHPDD